MADHKTAQQTNVATTLTGIILVGGAGTNVGLKLIKNMDPAKHPGLKFLTLNTDKRLLDTNFPPESPDVQKWGEKFIRHTLGGEEAKTSVTEGLGAGTDPELGRKAAESPDSKKLIEEFIKSVNNVMVLTGLGGGTGTGAGIVVTELCKQLGKPTVCIPFTPDPDEEGVKRYVRATTALEQIRELKAPTIQIDNSYLSDYISKVVPEEQREDLGQPEALAFVDTHSIVPMIGFIHELLQVAGDIISTDQNNWKTFLTYGTALFIGSKNFKDKEEAKRLTAEEIVEELAIGHFQNRGIVDKGKAMIFLSHGDIPFLKKKAVKVLMRQRICGNDQERIDNFETIEGSIVVVTDSKLWIAVAIIAEDVPFISPKSRAAETSKAAMATKPEERLPDDSTLVQVHFRVDGLSQTKAVPRALAERFQEITRTWDKLDDLREAEKVYEAVDVRYDEKGRVRIDRPWENGNSQLKTAPARRNVLPIR